MTVYEISELKVHPALAGLELLTARYRDHAYSLHTHATFVFGVVTAGVEQFRVGRLVNFAGPGSIIAVNPEEPHDGEKGCDAGWSYRTCYPSVTLMREVADGLGLKGLALFPEPVIHAPALARAFAAAHAGADRGEPLDREASMLAVLAQLVRRFGDPCGPGRRSEPPAARRRLAVYGDVIEAGLAAPLSLADLAEAAGVTRFQVVRDFNRAAGMTPGQYIRDRRIRRASSLLHRGTMELAEIAAATGFADQSHFTRAFKAARGVTPGAWRRAVAG